VGRMGTTSVAMALLGMLGRTAKSTTGLASTGSSVMPLPAAVALYDLCLSC
jgi:hypothetical protein